MSVQGYPASDAALQAGLATVIRAKKPASEITVMADSKSEPSSILLAAEKEAPPTESGQRTLEQQDIQELPQQQQGNISPTDKGGPDLENWFLETIRTWIQDLSSLSDFEMISLATVLLLLVGALITLYRNLRKSLLPRLMRFRRPADDGSGETTIKVSPAQRSIADRLISDRPLRPGDPDPLGHGAIAEGLSRFLRNENTQPPLSIAVLGAWGTGKSSIMSLLKGDMERRGYRPIWFNAWHHQKEVHLLAALLEALRLSGFPPFWSWRGLAFRARLFWIRTKRSPGPFLIVAGLIALQIVLAWAGWLPEATALLNSDATGLAVIPGLAATLMFLFTLQARFRNTLLDPVRAASSMAGGLRVTRYRDKLSFRHRFAEEFRDVTEALKPLKLVILIDDLDRCRPANVLEVLEAVNFLVTSGDCYIVMGLDRERVLGCVGHSFREIAEDVIQLEPQDGEDSAARTAQEKRWAFADQYLEKLLNIEIPVPAMQPEGAQALLMETAETPPPVQPPPRPRWPYYVVAVLALVGAALWFFSGLFTGPPDGSGSGKIPAPVDGPESILFQTWWFWALAAVGLLASFGAAAAAAAYTYRYSLISIGAILDDSDEFKKALEIWYPLIASKFTTPRAIKRFLNRIRYLAMCSRGRAKETPDDPLQGALDEATLVALAAAADCLPGGLDDMSQIEPTSDGEPAMKSRPGDNENVVIEGIAAAHLERFKTWPNSDEARRMFREIAGGVMVH